MVIDLSIECFRVVSFLCVTCPFDVGINCGMTYSIIYIYCNMLVYVILSMWHATGSFMYRFGIYFSHLLSILIWICRWTFQCWRSWWFSTLFPSSFTVKWLPRRSGSWRPAKVVPVYLSDPKSAQHGSFLEDSHRSNDRSNDSSAGQPMHDYWRTQRFRSKRIWDALDEGYTFNVPGRGFAGSSSRCRWEIPKSCDALHEGPGVVIVSSIPQNKTWGSFEKFRGRLTLITKSSSSDNSMVFYLNLALCQYFKAQCWPQHVSMSYVSLTITSPAFMLCRIQYSERKHFGRNTTIWLWYGG